MPGWGRNEIPDFPMDLHRDVELTEKEEGRGKTIFLKY